MKRTSCDRCKRLIDMNTDQVFTAVRLLSNFMFVDGELLRDDVADDLCERCMNRLGDLLIEFRKGDN